MGFLFDLLNCLFGGASGYMGTEMWSYDFNLAMIWIAFWNIL